MLSLFTKICFCLSFLFQISHQTAVIKLPSNDEYKRYAYNAHLDETLPANLDQVTELTASRSSLAVATLAIKLLYASVKHKSLTVSCFLINSLKKLPVC